MSNTSQVIKKAYTIALKELRDCYDLNGIVAGRHHYTDYWTRDEGFACLAAIELGEKAQVERVIHRLVSFQRVDGMIPFLVRKTLPLLNFIGIHIEVKPIPAYRSHKVLFLTEVVDSNAYFSIICSLYLKKYKSKEMFDMYITNIEQALAWYLRKMDKRNYLIREGLIAGWNDGIYKRGNVFINNLLVWKAVKEYLDLLDVYNKQPSSQWTNFFIRLEKDMKKVFWNGVYYVDWFDKNKNIYFDSSANFLSIAWGFSSFEESVKILKYADKHVRKKPFIRTVYPIYPWYRKEIANSLFGMGDYWSGQNIYWPEPACLYAIAKSKVGDYKEARDLIEGLAEVIVKHEGVYEVYSHKTYFNPVKKLFYRAENPYARGAALFILTLRDLRMVELVRKTHIVKNLKSVNI